MPKVLLLCKREVVLVKRAIGQRTKVRSAILLRSGNEEVRLCYFHLYSVSEGPRSLACGLRRHVLFAMISKQRSRGK